MPMNFIPQVPTADTVVPCNGLGMGFTLFRIEMLKDKRFEYGHWFKTKGGHPEWKWNENAEKPTVSPSILVPIEGQRCHSYIRNGFIDFLNDCDHELRGKSVALPDISTW